MAGTNDLRKPFGKDSGLTDDEIARATIEIGTYGRAQGAQVIIISSVLDRKGLNFTNIINSINRI